MSRDGLEEISQLELFCLQARQEDESELHSLLLEDDNFFSDNSMEGDDVQEQFKFEEDDELCEDTTPRRSSYTLSDYSGLHPAGLSKPPDLQLPFLAQELKSMALSGLSAHLEHGTFPDRMVTPIKDFSSLGCCTGPCLEAYLPCEAPSSEREDFLSLPTKQRNSCTNNGGQVLSRAVSTLSSSGRSMLRVAHLWHSPENTCHVKDGASQTAESMNAWPRVKAMSFKSASLSDRKPRSSFLRDQGAFAVSASETHGKVNTAGSVAAFSFEDMSEQEWACFMDCLERILQQDFTSQCTEPVGYRQRLGVSLPAFRQIHFR
ncbi:hypothetical protein GOP47_0026879 [Adiantum capillus-veneris]|nr:hypothetical protein GOP47_0026879 [Adiantum capillus-veneris]